MSEEVNHDPIERYYTGPPFSRRQYGNHWLQRAVLSVLEHPDAGTTGSVYPNLGAGAGRFLAQWESDSLVVLIYFDVHAWWLVAPDIQHARSLHFWR